MSFPPSCLSRTRRALAPSQISLRSAPIGGWVALKSRAIDDSLSSPLFACVNNGSDLAIRDDRHQRLRVRGPPDGQVIRDGIPLLDNVDNAPLADVEDVVAHVLDAET